MSMNKATKERASFWSKLKWAIYGLKIKIFKKKNTDKVLDNKRNGQSIFLFAILLFPIVQFIIFYIGVNINSILLAFQSYDDVKGYIFTGFGNFVTVFENVFVNGELAQSIKNSAIQSATSLLIGMPMQIMAAYLVFKKVPGSNVFKIMLFMPNMISSLVFVINARALIVEGFPVIFGDPRLNLLDKMSENSFYTVLIFGLWMQFAGGLIIYLSAMCSISTEVLDYGRLEPLTWWKELTHVIIPSIFPTITTYLVVEIAKFFTYYGFFYSFFGGEGRGETPFDTLGYYFFVKVVGDNVQLKDYPYAAASGLTFTLIVAPLTLLTKHLLEKYGPSED